MTQQLVLRRLCPEDPIEPIARLGSLAFGHPTDDTADWFQTRVGRDNIRVCSEAGSTDPLGIACRVPMGVYLGGKSIPQLGVLGVGVCPGARGSGVARWMMAECLREMQGEGVPLSILYSAMHPLYRSVGYENAGVLADAVIPAGMITAPRTTQPGWREATDQDTEAISSCYSRYAKHTAGMLDRAEYNWERLTKPKTGTPKRFVATNELGEVEAYCFYIQDKLDVTECTLGTAGGARMEVTDLAWSSPSGFDRVRAFLRGFASMVGPIELCLPPDSALLHTLPDRRFKLNIREPWMLRVVDVRAALIARGYPSDLSTSIDLEITDDQIDANNGTWTLRIEKGTATAERSRSDVANTAKLGIGALASLFTGFTSAHALRTSSRLECTEEQAAKADAIFATPSTPSMTDMF